MIGLREYAVFGIVNFFGGSLVGAFFCYKILRKQYELVRRREKVDVCPNPEMLCEECVEWVLVENLPPPSGPMHGELYYFHNVCGLGVRKEEE